MSEESSSQNEWHKTARKVAKKINLAWWLEKLSVPFVITALAGACLILVGRREIPQFPWLETALGGLAIFGALALLAFWLARRHFESADQALVRLEASMKLRNGLSAAKEGVTPWPALPTQIDDGTRWRWSRLVVPLLAAVFFLAASVILPVSARGGDDDGPRDEPQAWKDLQADIAALEEENTVQEEYLEELEERLEELRQQEDEEWFSHSSLEATDALNRMHGAQLESMERNMRKAERSLTALQKHGGQLGDAAKQRLLNDFEEALQDLGQGKMKPNKELLDQLQQLDPQNLGQLNQEQLDQLRENMKKQAENCAQCQGGGQGQAGQGNGGGEDWLDELLNEGQNGAGEEGAPGDPNQQGGRGGISRGPGTAPGVLGRLGGDVKPGDLEGLESDDLSRSLPGDLLQLADGEHDVDTSEVGVRAGGEVQSDGEGGDRIWKDSLLPAEKKALKEFFE